MESKEFIREVVEKISKGKMIILASALFFAVAFFLLFASKPAAYTSKSTLFPLTSPVENAINSSMLSGILGLADAPKSFTDEAAINIIELVSSRSIRESVAITRLPAFQNKTINELLLDEKREHKSLFSTVPDLPKDSVSVAVEGGELLLPDITAKMSRNGVLELYYTCTKKELVTPVSDVIITKLSEFYVELKRRKATEDYNFTLDKIDSLQHLIDKLDRRAINMQQTTMFTPNELLQYNLPKDDISNEKTRILRQRNMYINNRDEALWRLQKATPIIAVLDKPTAPFDMVKPPRALLTLLGLVAGALLAVLMLIRRPLYSYVKAELYNSVFAA